MVSLILVTYNRAERLALSITDILQQSFRDFELIICDDCSTDDTAEVCSRFAALDSRIIYVRQQKNKGMPGNVNHGFKMARYPYIGILHDGDRFAPTLVQRWFHALEQNPDVGFAFNATGITDANEQLKHAHQEFKDGVLDRKYLLHQVFFRRWRFDSPVWGEAFIRRSILEDYGYFHDEYKFFADVDFWMHTLHKYNAFYVRDVLMTGPDKEIQPRLFADKLIYTYLYMYGMHKYHRKQEFKNHTFTLIKEMVIFYIQAQLALAFNLILLLKHNNYAEYFSAGKSIYNRSLMLFLTWFIVLGLSPFIKIAFKLRSSK